MRIWIKYKKWLNAGLRLQRTIRVESGFSFARQSRLWRAKDNAYRMIMQAPANERAAMDHEGVMRLQRRG